MNGLKQIDKNDFPKCDDTLNLINLEKYFIEKSENLNYIEKSFFIYNWITMNISLDLSLKNNKEDKNLENIIKIGKSSNYDFAKLYKYLGEKLNLKIKYIEGYSKNLDEIENIPKDFIINHLYNLIEIEGNNYIIDTCFGSGEIIDSKYVKEDNNFYYCIEPSKMILFNYPKDKMLNY
jgi:transglutaminase/protease-like cytokinesis protein 3